MDLSVRLAIHPSIHLYIHPSIHPSIYLYICVCVCVCVLLDNCVFRPKHVLSKVLLPIVSIICCDWRVLSVLSNIILLQSIVYTEWYESFSVDRACLIRDNVGVTAVAALPSSFSLRQPRYCLNPLALK